MKKIPLFILILYLLISMTSFSKEHDKNNWNELNHLADHVLQLGKQQKYEEAKNVLPRFSPLFLKVANEKQATMKEMKMIIYAYEQAQSALHAVNMQDDERLNKLLQFRLTVNAVTNSHHPLWLDTQSKVLHPLDKAIKALQGKNRQQYDAYLNEFLLQYELIRPSLVIHLPEHESEKYDSYIKYLEHNRKKIGQNENGMEQLLEIQREFHALYHREKKANTEPDLIYLIYVVGGIIAMTLIYVGWRKYKGDRKKKGLMKREK